MDSESRALAWVANLRDQFNTFCSEADAIIPQEPIEYVRNQFLAAGESLKQFYSELLEGGLPLCNVGCLEERSSISPRNEENVDLLSHKISNISIDEPVGDICEDFASKEKINIGTGLLVVENRELETLESDKPSILATFSGLIVEEVECDAQVNSATSVQCSVVMEYPEETQEIGNFEEARFVPKVEYKLPDNEVTSSASACSMEAIHSCGLSEHIHAGEALGSYVTKPYGWQKLDESLFRVDSDDEFCSDADHISYQKTRKTASEGFDAEKEAKEWEKLDKDLCDSDWEIV